MALKSKESMSTNYIQRKDKAMRRTIRKAISLILALVMLKETVVIASMDKMPTILGYTVQAEDLTPVVNADNSIYFVNDEAETVFVLPAPYMFDAAG